ncbi:MAG: acyltransferase family protein [Anaerolineales bacterium]|nr:acyltransferase family protein [Anaerolineales bacterium]
MDNLRTIIILLVVMYHVGGVYEAAGLWAGFWIVDDPDTITWVGIVGIVFDIIVMPTMFFIAGYLTPPSLDNRSGWEFLKKKFQRLIIPWLIAVFTLIPLYKVIFLYSRSLPQEPWYTYFHFNNPNSQNWLWFLPVLFAFDIVYLLPSKTGIKLSKLSLNLAVWGSFVIALAYSFVIGGLVGFRSWTLTPVIDFENEKLLVYFLAFLVGALCFRKNAFAGKPQRKTLYIVANSVAWLPITVHIFARLYPILYWESFAVTPLFRLIWFASFHLSVVSMVYTLVVTFWLYFDKTGPVWAELNRDSYGVYIIHVIVIGVFGTLLMRTGLPALAKYPLLIIITYLVSNLLVSLFRAGKRVLKSGQSKSIPQTTDAQ